MTGGPLPGRWMEGRALGVPSGSWTDAPRVPEEVTDSPPLDVQTARRLGLFAYNVARKFFPCRADLVEEAVQEVLTRTCERWERANRRGQLEAWVVNTATYVCHEKLREEQRGKRFTSLPPERDPDEDVVRSRLLAQALGKLTTRQRMVIVWRYLFDFSVTETGTALGLTDSKVRDASHNGIQRLRNLVGDQWSDWA